MIRACTEEITTQIWASGIPLASGIVREKGLGKLWSRLKACYLWRKIPSVTLRKKLENGGGRNAKTDRLGHFVSKSNSLSSPITRSCSSSLKILFKLVDYIRKSGIPTDEKLGCQTRTQESCLMCRFLGREGYNHLGVILLYEYEKVVSAAVPQL